MCEFRMSLRISNLDVLKYHTSLHGHVEHWLGVRYKYKSRSNVIAFWLISLVIMLLGGAQEEMKARPVFHCS